MTENDAQRFFPWIDMTKWHAFGGFGIVAEMLLWIIIIITTSPPLMPNHSSENCIWWRTKRTDSNKLPSYPVQFQYSKSNERKKHIKKLFVSVAGIYYSLSSTPHTNEWRHTTDSSSKSTEKTHTLLVGTERRTNSKIEWMHKNKNDSCTTHIIWFVTSVSVCVCVFQMQLIKMYISIKIHFLCLLIRTNSNSIHYEFWIAVDAVC